VAAGLHRQLREGRRLTSSSSSLSLSSLSHCSLHYIMLEVNSLLAATVGLTLIR
jgi:hypothetical protein